MIRLPVRFLCVETAFSSLCADRRVGLTDTPRHSNPPPSPKKKKKICREFQTPPDFTSPVPRLPSCLPLLSPPLIWVFRTHFSPPPGGLLAGLLLHLQPHPQPPPSCHTDSNPGRNTHTKMKRKAPLTQQVQATEDSGETRISLVTLGRTSSLSRNHHVCLSPLCGVSVHVCVCVCGCVCEREIDWSRHT